jgi:pilus assembly protein CpaE
MKDVLRIAIVDPSDTTRDSLRDSLLGLENIWLEAECSRYEFFLDVLQQSKPDMAMVALDADTARGLQLIQQITAELPQVPVLAVSSRTEGQFILQTLRSGAKEFLTRPIALEELLAAVQRVRSQSRAALGGVQEASNYNNQPSSTVITICGSRGGIGCTSLAVNLSCALALDPDFSVALIDLDLALGDTDVSLDLMPNYTLADVAMNVDRLDMTFLRRSLSKHTTGVSLLPHPVQLEDMNLIKEEHLHRVVGLLRAAYTHVVMDLSKGFRATDITAMTASDMILLVVQLELSSLRNAVRLLMSLGNMDGLDQKVKIVVNRVGAEHQEITLKKAEETLGRPIYWQIPNDAKNMRASQSLGVPLVQHAPRCKLWQNMEGLADLLTGKEEPEEAQPKRKLFSFF